MLLVGSSALTRHTCGGDPRVPNDYDYICTHEEAKTFVKQMGFQSVIPDAKGSTLICLGSNIVDKPVELMIAWPGSSTEAILQLPYAPDSEISGRLRVASLNILYLLKMSHRYLKNSPHFRKTMRDIQLMRTLGAWIDRTDILKQREKETYDYAHPSLMRNKKNFFDPAEGVGYRFDHDTIHIAMAVEPLRPAYTHYQRDDAQVSVDRAKWEACGEGIKLFSVLEESLVLALERSQIPFRGRLSPQASFKMALMKVCTSISSGWWREWAWEHYDEVLRLFEAMEKDESYVVRFDKAVASGIVKELDGTHHE